MSTTIHKSAVLSPIRVAKVSKKPFSGALADLMTKRDISYPRLSDATKTVDPNGKGLSHAYLHRLTHGAKPPPAVTIALIAAALRVSPEYFKEYRQHVVAQRAKLLADEIGLPEVLAALDALEARQHGSNPPTDD